MFSRHTLLLTALLFTVVIGWLACSNSKPGINTTAHEWLYRQADSLDTATGSLLQLAMQQAPEKELQYAFLHCRRLYKKLEWFSEYYAPSTSRGLNGPPLPEIEVEEHKLAEPSGLQVIEALLYPYDSSTRTNLVTEIRSFQSGLIPLRHTIENTVLDTAHLFDACKLEMFRVITTGISGFDTPLCGTGLAEAATSIETVKEIMQLLHAPDNLLTQLTNAAAATAGKTPGSFNYASFITATLNPLTRSMVNWYTTTGLTPLATELALQRNAGSLFDSGAFNSNFFVHNPEAMLTPEKAALGRFLFNNNNLAGNGKRSCQSCHQPDKAFTDGLMKSSFLEGHGQVQRNTPTLLYAGLQQAQFYDMRSPTLENQAMDVLSNKQEMHSSAEQVAAWINNTSAMQQRFKQAFPTMEKEVLPRHIIMALACYIRTLQPFRSNFDRYMQGDTKAMNDTAIQGFNLFMSKARCATCHFLPLFNGTAGPSFTNTESEILGTLSKPESGVLDGDSGRYIHTRMPELLFAFKTPTLRNIAVTGPYMHNGTYTTLQQVVSFYNKGGAAGYNIHLPNQTLATDELQLTPAEQQQLVVFLQNLTDR